MLVVLGAQGGCQTSLGPQPSTSPALLAAQPPRPAAPLTAQSVHMSPCECPPFPPSLRPISLPSELCYPTLRDPASPSLFGLQCLELSAGWTLPGDSLGDLVEALATAQAQGAGHRPQAQSAEGRGLSSFLDRKGASGLHAAV